MESANRETCMIVEVRTYKVKRGLRDDFLDFFAKRSIPALRAHGMRVVGPLLDLEDPDVFIWLRIFPSLEERDRMKSAFYDGPVWKDELEAIAMPMLESYSAAVTSVPENFENDLN
jgi:NIPSNAP